MNILLAPAETKNSGGEEKVFCKSNFFLENLFSKRENILNQYEDHIASLDLDELSKWFSLKKMSEVERYSESLVNKKTLKAINRYEGVAFDALNYTSLTDSAKEYVDNKVILFSNLFGPIKANDLIPDYKFKQGAKLPNTAIEKYYLENFSESLDEYLDEEIIDLRAGFYEKFYKTKNKKVLTFKFLKDGKVVSHWAKHYRGVLLKELALNNINSFSEFMDLKIDNLEISEIIEKNNVKTLIMNIID
ncbi:MAG: YaaA family protein [Campylobacteraceae bacterium]|nr:YaaA family protein [Campylobacteraceae bacterium]